MMPETVTCWCGRSHVALDSRGRVDPYALPIDTEGAEDDYDPAALEASGAELAICMCGRLERADLIDAVLAAASCTA